jgi:hypothetical protein
MLSAVQPHVLPVLKRFGILDLLGPENVFAATRDAINSVEDRRHTCVDHLDADGRKAVEAEILR